MNGSILTSLYVSAAVFLSLGGLCVVLKLLTSRRRDDSSFEAPEHDPRLTEEWFDHRAHRQAPPIPPMFPQSEAEHFRAAQEALEQGFSAPLPPPPAREQDVW